MTDNSHSGSCFTEVSIIYLPCDCGVALSVCSNNNNKCDFVDFHYHFEVPYV